MTKDEFLANYNISAEDFASSGISFDTLNEIVADYRTEFQRYDDAGANLVRNLLRFKSVHSVKYRIKDPEHLMAKIVRKKMKAPKLDINTSNYAEHIHDIIGIRILHLFKEDWNSIHEQLTATFKLIGKPEANVRKGDLPHYVNYYKSNGCKVTNHPAGYRSVHYLIKTEPTRNPLICEVQVRTIFEEAWSEIDHTVRYPYFMDNAILNQYLTIFNRLAGSADEMGGFVINLKQEALLNAKNLMELEKLQGQIQKSSLKETEKRAMEEGLQKIVLPSSETRSIPFPTWRKALESLNGKESMIMSKLLTPELAAAIEAIKIASPPFGGTNLKK